MKNESHVLSDWIARRFRMIIANPGQVEDSGVLSFNSIPDKKAVGNHS